jgi:hypothetical protein
MLQKKFKINKNIVHEEDCHLLTSKKDYKQVGKKEVVSNERLEPCPSCKPLGADYLPCIYTESIATAANIKTEDLGRIIIEPMLGAIKAYLVKRVEGETVVEIAGSEKTATFGKEDKLIFAGKRLQFPWKSSI